MKIISIQSVSLALDAMYRNYSKKKIDQKLIEKRTIKFTDKKPKDKEFESDYVYLVKKEDSDIDIEVYDDNVSDFSFIDLTLFDVFVRIVLACLFISIIERLVKS